MPSLQRSNVPTFQRSNATGGAAALLAGLVRSRLASWVGLAALTAGAFLPTGGFGVPLCSFKLATGIPCLGCGFTRAFLWTAHGRPDLGLTLHPLGVFAALGCALLAGLLLLPRRREALAEWLAVRGRAALFTLLGVAAVTLASLAARYWQIFALGERGPW